MKKTILIIASLLISAFATQAQDMTLDEILANYFENTGGIDNWKAVKGVRMKAKINQGGMDIPITLIQMTDGRQYTKLVLQGKEIAQGVFDGEVVWSHNFMTMKPEKGDNETTENIKRDIGNFPSPFLNYEEKGYKVELLGKENAEGTECFKIKLTKKPQLVDGEDVDNVEFYFFDTENFVPIVVESEIKTGQLKGQIGVATFSDYQEVDGLFFAFSIGQGIKGQGSQVINFDSIELNPEVDDAIFKFPEETETTEKKKEDTK